MSIGIKATNSKNLKVINCTFSGLDIDIELNNVAGFTSVNNKFSHSDPKVLIENLYKEILNSNLSKDDKRVLFQEVIYSLNNRSLSQVSTAKDKLLQLVGAQARNYFIQLAAAVSAGLIIKEL